MSTDRPLRVMVTGSRDWEDRGAILQALMLTWFDAGRPSNPILVSGGRPTGADRLAEQIWLSNGFNVEQYPAAWETAARATGETLGMRAIRRRIREMVDSGADICHAFVTSESYDIRETIRIAREAGVPVRVHEPFG